MRKIPQIPHIWESIEALESWYCYLSMDCIKVPYYEEDLLALRPRSCYFLANVAFSYLQVYDYGFSPHRGEGFKLAIHHHMDQPIMALSDVDISPGFVTQLSVTPTLTVTTEEAKDRFTPDERVCYFDEEFRFKYLPQELYR